MTWINFLSYLGMAYVLYYLSVYALDRMTAPRSAVSNELPVLTFSESVEPKQVSLADVVAEAPGSGHVPPSIGMGGVSLKELFDLARQDAIQFTRSVSF